MIFYCKYIWMLIILSEYIGIYYGNIFQKIELRKLAGTKYLHSYFHEHSKFRNSINTQKISKLNY